MEGVGHGKSIKPAPKERRPGEAPASPCPIYTRTTNGYVVLSFMLYYIIVIR